jgi:hypothetical protein
MERRSMVTPTGVDGPVLRVRRSFNLELLMKGLSFGVLLLLLPVCASAGTGRRRPAPAPPEKVLTVEQYIRLAGQPGDYVVEGFAVSIEICPPCPKGATCEYCRPDNVLIADSPKPDLSAAVPAAAYLLFHPADQNLEQGRRYRFWVEVTGWPPPAGLPSETGHLRRAKPLP